MKNSFLGKVLIAKKIRNQKMSKEIFLRKTNNKQTNRFIVGPKSIPWRC